MKIISLILREGWGQFQHFLCFSVTQRVFGQDQPNLYVLNLHLFVNCPYHLKITTNDIVHSIYANESGQMLQLTPTLES